MLKDGLHRARRLMPELQRCCLDLPGAFHDPTSDLCEDGRDSGAHGEMSEVPQATGVTARVEEFRPSFEKKGC